MLAKKITSTLAIFLLSFIYINGEAKPTFTPQAGDLIFVDLNCGEFCDGIDEATTGVNNTYISHVGMVVFNNAKQAEVIEAVGKGVVETPLKVFLAKSLDENGKPRALVGRLKPQYQPLIPVAIKIAKKQLGQPYNDSFYPDASGYYCSQLIYDVFKQANDNQPLFKLIPMNFYARGTNTIAPQWIAYYEKLGVKVPQGVLGSNPGTMSNSPAIDIVYQYGNLRTIHFERTK